MTTTARYAKGIDMHTTQGITWDLNDNGNGRTLEQLSELAAFALISNMLFVSSAS